MSKDRFRLLTGAGVSVLTCAVGWAQAPAKPDAGIAATIGGKPVTTAELDEKILKANMKLAQQLYDARKAAIDEIIIDRALGEEAKTKGVTVEALMKERAAGKITPVTDPEIQAYYDGNKARMQGKTLEQVSGQIKSTLNAQRENEARNNLLSELKAKAEVKVLLDVPRVEVAVAPNDPAKGPPTAKVTIVEFSEFQ
jgi:hypothetical protein